LENDEAVIFELIITKERSPGMATTFSYTYSKRTKQALIWTPNCWRYKTLVEEKLEKPTTCLLNLYHTGTEGMGWHSDAEKNLKNGAIASVSFGAEKIYLQTQRQQGNGITELIHGSLLVMKDETQTHWQHRLPPTTRITTPRVNLTFRTIEIL
jgi:alkylated DNA repair dioxygenase AlkB